MKNKINEASIKLDVNGLESSDFDTLSRMLALAGQAETQGGNNPGMSELPKMQAFDFDAFGGDEAEVEPIPSADPFGEPEAELSVEPMAEPEVGSEEELSLDLDGSPSLESGDEFEEEEDDFDFGRMSELAGLGESVSLATSEDEAGEGEVEDADELAKDEEDAAAEELSEKLLPDLSLDEDAEARSDDGDRHHVVDSKEHGPFSTEREAVHDAMRVTNGTEFEHFAIIPGKDGYYWRRNLQEGFDNEPEPEVVDMDGIENSRHEFKRVPGTALGDNPLKESEDEDSDKCDKCHEDPCECSDEKLDEDVSDILESINARYNEYIKGL